MGKVVTVVIVCGSNKLVYKYFNEGDVCSGR